MTPYYERQQADHYNPNKTKATSTKTAAKTSSRRTTKRSSTKTK